MASVTPTASKYSPSKAAAGYSTATGVGAGFSLAAVVLVFTIAATTRKPPLYFLGFATAMFTVGAVGLLICSFSYATLSSTKDLVAAFLHELLNSSALTICFLAELAGFDALARPYVPKMTSVFVLIICASVILSPLWIWIVQVEVVRKHGRVPAPPEVEAVDTPADAPQDDAQDAPEGVARESDERRIWFVAVVVAVVGLVTVAVTMAIRSGGVGSGVPYRSLSLSMLAYIGAAVATGAWLSSRTHGDPRADLWMLGIVAALQLGLMGWLIASLP